MFFFVVYIFVFNIKVFKYVGIMWEWGIVFIVVGFFFVGVELWKFGKCVYFCCMVKKIMGK